MAYFKIGTTDYSDYVAGLKVALETITSDKSGRNAAGTMCLDIIATKYKIFVDFIPMSENEAYSILHAVSGYSDLTVYFQDPFTKTLKSMTCYTGTPEVSWYTLSGGRKLTQKFSINFIEM